MKIILTGGTGFVGSEVLSQLLLRADVDSVTCLTRRRLTVESPKLRTILHEDFTFYEGALAQDLAEHNALIWAVGGKASDGAYAALYERTTVTMTVACATAIAARIEQPFRFGYLSGMGADPTETATFPWQRLTRHLKGRTEAKLKAITERVAHFHVTCYRPADILPKAASSIVDKLLSPIAVRVDRLALTMIEESVRNVAEHFATLDNSTIRRIADPSH